MQLRHNILDMLIYHRYKTTCRKGSFFIKLALIYKNLKNIVIRTFFTPGLFTLFRRIFGPRCDGKGFRPPADKCFFVSSKSRFDLSETLISDADCFSLDFFNLASRTRKAVIFSMENSTIGLWKLMKINIFFPKWLILKLKGVIEL